MEVCIIPSTEGPAGVPIRGVSFKVTFHDEKIFEKHPFTTGTIESPVRLAGGSTPYEGRLEIFHDGRWGTVCNNAFDTSAAKIICNSIGYPRYLRD